MVSTRHKKYSGSPQPAAPPPAPQQPQRGGNTTKAVKKPVKKPANKPATKAKPTTREDEDSVDEDEEAVDEEEEEAGNDAASKTKSRKRPTAAVDEGPSPKALKTGAASPSKRNATRFGSPTADAASVEQAPAPKKGKSKAKAKSTKKEDEAAAAAAAAAANVSALFYSTMFLVRSTENHVLMFTSLGLNRRTVHKTMSKGRNPRKDSKKKGQPF